MGMVWKTDPLKRPSESVLRTQLPPVKVIMCTGHSNNTNVFNGFFVWPKRTANDPAASGCSPSCCLCNASLFDDFMHGPGFPEFHRSMHLSCISQCPLTTLVS